MRPLLLSAVSPPSSNFTAAVDNAVTEIADLLNGSDVNLTVTFHEYINTVVFNLLSIDETSISDSCVSQAIFNHVNSKTGSVAELSELLQNISTVIKILKQVITVLIINMYIAIYSYLKHNYKYVTANLRITMFIRSLKLIFCYFVI